MKVSVYKLEDGEMAVLGESAPGKGRAPVMLSDITLENIKTKVSSLVAEMRQPKRQARLPL